MTVFSENTGKSERTTIIRLDKNKRMFMTILYADDDVDDRMLFTEAFSEISPSVSCITVCDGQELLRTLDKTQNLPDVIFLDINMPVMDGRECLIALKRDRRLRTIPVVMYSTAANQNEIKAFHQLGATTFIRKPGSYPELRADLAKFFCSIQKNSGTQ